MHYDHIVYANLDTQNRITAVNSSGFLRDTDGWREIDKGIGVKYYHAQGNYFPLSICDKRDIYHYMTALIADNPDREAFHTYEYEGETWGIYERTQDEMDADYVEPASTPSQLDIIEAQVTYTAMMTDTLLEE